MSISERKHVSEGEAAARRIEIFTGAGRRRSWSPREKAAIVAESFEEGVRRLPCRATPPRVHGNPLNNTLFAVLKTLFWPCGHRRLIGD
jgi:hypothetical protein